MLIEDDEVSNYIFTKLVSITGFALQTVSFQKGADALIYLRENANHPDRLPEIIFLDIILYDMSGWEFLDRYEQLEDAIKSRIHLVILTTSSFENDRQKAGKYPSVKKYIQKPITADSLSELRNDLKKNRRTDSIFFSFFS